jgi:hypothetical protein
MRLIQIEAAEGSYDLQDTMSYYFRHSVRATEQVLEKTNFNKLILRASTLHNF